MIMDDESGSMGIAGLKVGSLNCNGLGEKNKLQKELTWLKNKQENIFILQETHSTIKAEDTWKKSWGRGSGIFQPRSIKIHRCSNTN